MLIEQSQRPFSLSLSLFCLVYAAKSIFPVCLSHLHLDEFLLYGCLTIYRYIYLTEVFSYLKKMATHHIENGSSGNQYYFDANNASSVSPGQRSGQDRVYATSGTTAISTEYSPYAAGVSGVRSQQQHIQSDRNLYHEDNSSQLPQQHQSVAGFSKTTSQQQYQSSSSPVPQVRATVRAVTSQDQQQYQQRPQQSHSNYDQQASSQPSYVSSQQPQQQQQYQYDSRQQHTNVPGYYQSPGSAQYSNQNVDQRTESPTRNRDQYGQVLVRDLFRY